MVAWNACCPGCRNPYRWRAFDGDDHGPIEPDRHPLAAKPFVCHVDAASETFTLGDVREWEREDGVARGVPLRVDRDRREVGRNRKPPKAWTSRTVNHAERQRAARRWQRIGDP